MGGDPGQGEKVVESKIAIAYSVQTVGSDAREAELTRCGFASDGKGTPRERAGAHGASVCTGLGILQTCKVPRESFRMSQQKMREKNGLGMLHVGHAGHGSLDIGFGLEKKTMNERQQSFANFRNGSNHKEPKIGGDEFVAASPGVKFPTERAQLVCKRLFDEVMNIFCLRAEVFQPGRILASSSRDFIERDKRLAHFCFTQNTCAMQSLGPGAIHGNFISKKPAIKRKGALKRVELRVRRL